MKDELISHKVAKVAKEKKFNIPCFDYYNPKYNTTVRGVEYDSDRDVKWDWNNNSTSKIASPYPNTEIKGQCSAPTQSLLQRWLREVHNIITEVTYHMDGYAGVVYDMRKGMKGCKKFDTQMKTAQARELRGTRYNHITYLEQWEDDHRTFEEALEKGLFEALKLIKR
jgi:hypothetical protein